LRQQLVLGARDFGEILLFKSLEIVDADVHKVLF
jgi:hypothetical protein